jgi:hypothetical protein
VGNLQIFLGVLDIDGEGLLVVGDLGMPVRFSCFSGEVNGLVVCAPDPAISNAKDTSSNLSLVM